MRHFLQRVVQDQALEARWLNTLSLMEFMGARKIAKTVCRGHPPLMVLEHWADETRHAYAFRKLAGQMGCRAEDYLAREGAVDYFQGLDHQLADWITQLTGREDSYQNYLLVTTMIEHRAIKLYPLYKSLTSNPFVGDELQRIILEESQHRLPIEETLKKILAGYGQENLAYCEELEQNLFDRFATALTQVTQ